MCVCVCACVCVQIIKYASICGCGCAWAGMQGPILHTVPAFDACFCALYEIYNKYILLQHLLNELCD